VKQSIRDFFMASLSAAEETKRQAEKTRKAIQTNIETLIAPVDRADVNLRAKLSLYQMERQRIAAKKRADDEAEARKQADEQKLADAVRLENLAKATGDTVYQQQAEQVLEAPVSIEVHAKAAPPKLEGVSFVDEVGVVVDDWSKLLWSVARGEVKPHAKTMEKVREALTSWLVVEAKQQGDAFAVPGVTRTVRQVPRVRA
jgi:hypothetical protein